MPAEIKCPKCSHDFTLNDVLTKELDTQLKQEREKLNQDAAKWKKEKEEELADLLAKKEKEFAKQKIIVQENIEQQLRKQLTADYDVQLQMLEKNNASNEEKLKIARQKEIVFLQKEQELKNKEQELELNFQKKIIAEKQLLAEQINKEVLQKNNQKEIEFQLKEKEYQKQLEDQKQLVEQMRKKAEQGSNQLQGEVQELLLEDVLRNEFPFDTLSEVAKGKRGADCLLTVRNKFANECGKIIFESKRTENFGKDWIEKLKTDMRNAGADVAILVTIVMPKDVKTFKQIEGVWVCTFAEVAALTHVIREGIFKIHIANANQQNKGDKMNMLYNYFTSNEFVEQWTAMREGFLHMKMSIQRERDAMEKLWKMREKQLEKILLNASGIQGSVEGISGQSDISFNLLGMESGGEVE